MMDSYELVCQKSEEITGKGFEIKAECDSENEWGDFNSCWATLTFYKDGKVIKWNEKSFQELIDRIDTTYLGEKHYKILNNESVYIEVNNFFNEELNEYTGISGIDEESQSILDEHIQDVKEVYKTMMIRKEINQIIEKANLIYCDICYDAECEDNEDIWLYDLIAYDRAEKINQLITKLNKYAKTVVYKNMDDGDYTIECIINTKEVKL